jgi:hypothetical protein
MELDIHMKMRSGLLILFALSPLAQAGNECRPMPAVRGPLPFHPGEVLRYSVNAVPAGGAKLDLTGLRAAHATLWVGRPSEHGLQLHVEAQTQTFVSKLLKLRGEATAFVDPQTLLPRRVMGRMTGDGEPYRARVIFGEEALEDFDGETRHYSAGELDVLGTAYRMRAIPMAVGDSSCASLIGVNQRWRVQATVEDLAWVRTPYAELEAFHIRGTATNTSTPSLSAAFDAYFSTDARRLPLMLVVHGRHLTMRVELVDVSDPSLPPPRAARPRWDR